MAPDISKFLFFSPQAATAIGIKMANNQRVGDDADSGTFLNTMLDYNYITRTLFKFQII